MKQSITDRRIAVIAVDDEIAHGERIVPATRDDRFQELDDAALSLGGQSPRDGSMEEIMSKAPEELGPPLAYMFFNETEARTVAAMAERIVPGGADGPGATDAEVIVYIDRALAGFGRHLQRLYRRGVKALNRLADKAHGGKAFAALSSGQQDKLLERLAGWIFSTARDDNSSRPQDWMLLAEFFGAVRLHTIEGMFCDPMYGGNKDCAGWKLIGFPGAQWGYSAEQMKLGFDATTIPLKTLADLRREHTGKSGGRT